MMTAVSDQLQVLFFAVAAPWACVCLFALIMAGAVVWIYVREGLERRAAKWARIDVQERRYRERLAERNSRPAVSVKLNIDGREAAREIARAIRRQDDGGARC